MLISMELDSEWLTNLEQEDQKYAEFYKESTKQIEVFCLYVNQKNFWESIMKQFFLGSKGVKVYLVLKIYEVMISRESMVF